MNTTATVVNMPEGLERLARRILAALAQEPRLHADWVENQLEKADALFQAKKQFPHTPKFGEWCSANGFGEDVIDKNTRAALIDFGGDLPRARTLMKKYYANWSVRVLHDKHWRVPNAGKSRDGGGQRNTRRGKGDMEKSEAAFALIMDEVDATGNYPNSKADDADAKYGASHATLEGVIFAVRKVREFKAEQKQVVAEAVAEVKAEVSDEALIASAKPPNKTQQVSIDAIVRRETKRLEKEHATRMAKLEKEYAARRTELEKLAKAREDSFTARLSAEAEARYKKRFPHLEEREIEAARMQELYQERLRTKAFFTRDQAKTILMCLHPDGSESRSKEKLNAAFLLFNAKLTILTGETKEG